MDPIDDVDIYKWVLEAVQVNPGFGIERLLSRIHERFPESSAAWDRKNLTNWLRRAGHTDDKDYLAQLEDEKWRGGTFQDPMDADGDGDITEEEVIKFVRFHQTEDESDSDLAKLRSNKHKIAWHLAKKFDLEGDLDSYYSQWDKSGGGGSVKIRFWSDLISSKKMGLGEYVSNKRQRMAETIFIENNLEWDGDAHAAASGGGVNVPAFLVLCDHFDVKMPGPLWAQEEEDEDDILVALQDRINPKLESNEEAIGELVEEFVEKRIFVPEFQRQFTWSLKKQRLLIDSILTGIPLPSVLLIREEGKDWWLVDGQQRVTTLRRFIQPESNNETFDLGTLGHPNGRYSNLTFVELPDEIKEAIRETKIPVTRIRGLEENKRAVYQLFHRYNTGGETLNAAEIRHAIFHENKYHQELFRLAGENQDKDDFRTDTKKVRKAIGAKYSKKTASKYKWYNRVSRFFGYRYAIPGGSTTETVFGFFEERDEDSDGGYKPPMKKLGPIFIETAELCDKIYGSEFKFKKLKKDSSAGTFGDIPYTMQMVASRMLLDDHEDQVDKVKKVRGKIIEKWKEYYMAELFEQRQNSSNIWRWQREWCSILEELVRELGESDYEIMLATAQELFEEGGKSAVGGFLDSLGQKDHPEWEKLQKECYKRGWC